MAGPGAYVRAGHPASDSKASAAIGAAGKGVTMSGEKTSGLAPRDMTRAAAAVALLAVSAWVTVPLGPVPFTLQTMALTFVLVALPGREAVLAVAVYVLLGAIGAPVFSGMRGGVGVLFGPTGGFILGFVLAALAAAAVRRAMPASPVRDVLVAALAIACSHGVGVAWLATVGSLGLVPAFLAGSAPFLLLDAIKGAAGIVLARGVRHAVPGLA